MPSGRFSVEPGLGIQTRRAGCRLALFEPGQHALRPYRGFHPPPRVLGFSGWLRRSWLRHCRRSSCLVLRHGLCASTSLHPLAPRALPRFIATTDALTPARRFFGPLGHERRSGSGGSPCLPRPHFQPFCPQPPRRLDHDICARSRLLSIRGRRPEDLTSAWRPKDSFLPGSWSGLRAAPAGSPVGAAESGLLCVMSSMSRHYGRVVHLRQLSTPCRHGCSSLRFQAGERSAWRGLSPRCVYALTGALGQTSGLPVSRASGPVFRPHPVHGAGGSVNWQTGGLPHT